MFAETEKVNLAVIGRTQRILARISLAVSGQLSDGTWFGEDTFTSALNANGCVFQLRATAKKGQVLSIIQPSSGRQAFCVVAHVGLVAKEFATVRVQLLGATSEFWDIAARPDSWEGAVALPEEGLVASHH